MPGFSENIKPVIEICSSATTPYVNINLEKGDFRLDGISIPEDAKKFYDPIAEIIEKYCKKPNASTTFSIRLSFINTASSKYLLRMFQAFESINRDSNKIIINWLYEEDDSDIMEEGQDFNSIISVPIRIIPYKPGAKLDEVI